MPRNVESFTNRCLDAAIERLKLPSDYALSQVLEISPQAIAKMRAGGSMGTTTAARLAEILELDPLKVIADAELERGSDPTLWKRIRAAAAIVGGVGTCILAVQFARSSGADPHQVTEALALLAGAPGGLCIMLSLALILAAGTVYTASGELAELRIRRQAPAL